MTKRYSDLDNFVKQYQQSHYTNTPIGNTERAPVSEGTVIDDPRQTLPYIDLASQRNTAIGKGKDTFTDNGLSKYIAADIPFNVPSMYRTGNNLRRPIQAANAYAYANRAAKAGGSLSKYQLTRKAPLSVLDKARAMRDVITGAPQQTATEAFMSAAKTGKMSRLAKLGKTGGKVLSGIGGPLMALQLGANVYDGWDTPYATKQFHENRTDEAGKYFNKANTHHGLSSLVNNIKGMFSLMGYTDEYNKRQQYIRDKRWKNAHGVIDSTGALLHTGWDKFVSAFRPLDVTQQDLGAQIAEGDKNSWIGALSNELGLTNSEARSSNAKRVKRAKALEVQFDKLRRMLNDPRYAAYADNIKGLIERNNMERARNIRNLTQH